MAVLIVGLILFLGMHTVKLAAPGWRGRAVLALGEGPYKGLYALLSLTGVALIAWGFSMAWETPTSVYTPPPPLRIVAAALLVPALILAVASLLPAGRIKRVVRHPLFIGTCLWALAHLFVNGDLAGLVLFGSFLAWTVVRLIADRWTPAPAATAPQSDLIAIAVGLTLYGLLVWRLHLWLFGASPLA